MKSVFWTCLLAIVFCKATDAAGGGTKSVELKNPIIPGYFADPSVVQHEGKFYLYATADPWGTDFLSCWVSDDFKDWTFQKLNWPTKSSCTTGLSTSSMVWAPSVVEKDGMFYMYVSVGSEVWCGEASHPLGPWKNMLGDKPLVAFDQTKYYHVIDAEAFIDDDGKAYLYWGSGWDWTNGHCFAAELADDMHSFKTKPVEVTPAHYFEAPFMLKRGCNYYLTYSEGITMDETYEVRYAVGDNPFGPFKEADNSPILKYDDSLNVYGPGHHTIVPFEGADYILYHRHRLPFQTGTAFRQTCAARLGFDNGSIKNITPLSSLQFPDLTKGKKKAIHPASIEATSSFSDYAQAGCVLDADYATRWECADGDNAPMLTADFGKEVELSTVEIRPEYPWKPYYFKVEVSADGKNWQGVADYSLTGVSGSPVNANLDGKWQFVRIAFNAVGETKPSLWELKFY